MDQVGLIAELREQGISDEHVLAAMRDVPRDAFVPADLKDRAWENYPLPIGEGQTISQPFIVAYMTQTIAIEPGDKVLEIGTGSGYQAAVLSAFGAEVWSVEVVAELAERGAGALSRAGFDDVHLRIGQGREGWPGIGDFDAIVVTAASRDAPPPLLTQLAPPAPPAPPGRGGRLILPLVTRWGDEVLTLLTRTSEGLTKQELLAVRFVPLVE